MSNEKGKSESLLKVIAITVLAILGLSLLASTFFNNNNGYMGRRMMGHGMGRDEYYYQFDGLTGGALNLTVQLFWVFVLVALVFSLYFFVKKVLEHKTAASLPKATLTSQKNIDCPNCGIGISEEFKFCPACTSKLVEKCSRCQNNLQLSWSCCPYCGERKEENTR